MGEYHETLSFVPRLTGLFFQRLVYRGYLPPPHSLRQAQGCGFPHTQVAKRTAPFCQSLKKRFHGLAGQENSRQKRHPQPMYGSGYGVKVIIDLGNRSGGSTAFEPE
jgi:hypothetical protein